MRRIRWFSANWPLSLRTLASRMKANAFTEDSSDGFLLERARDSLIEGRYIEKMSYQEKLTDPFGREFTLDRVDYRQVEFGMFADFPQLEIRDAPRSTQAYMSKLLQLSDFSLTVAPLVVDLIEWVDAFHAEFGRKVLIDSVQISGLEFDSGVTGRVSLRGGKDVREAVKNITKNRPYVLNRVQMQVFDGDRISPVQMTNTGSIGLQEQDLNEMYAALRSSLRSVVGRKR
jgi:hypothetical protein